MKIVSKEQVEEFMAKYFPSCPLCDSNTGWNVSGIQKNYVQCRSCGARWMSGDFIRCKELKELTLWDPSEDGKGSNLKFKKHPIAFWQNLDIKKLEAEKAELTAEKGELLFSEETTDEELRSAIKKSQLEITKYDKTYGFGKLAVWLRMNSAQTMTIFMTRALLEEIRILILQNELILRELKSLKEVQGS